MGVGRSKCRGKPLSLVGVRLGTPTSSDRGPKGYVKSITNYSKTTHRTIWVIVKQINGEKYTERSFIHTPIGTIFSLLQLTSTKQLHGWYRQSLVYERKIYDFFRDKLLVKTLKRVLIVVVMYAVSVLLLRVNNKITHTGDTIRNTIHEMNIIEWLKDGVRIP